MMAKRCRLPDADPSRPAALERGAVLKLYERACEFKVAVRRAATMNGPKDSP